jgi:hypothetical protein
MIKYRSVITLMALLPLAAACHPTSTLVPGLSPTYTPGLSHTPPSTIHVLTHTPKPVPTYTPTHTPTPVPTYTLTPTPTPIPTYTPTPTSSPGPAPDSPVGQIVFGAYPCGSDPTCNTYPGVGDDFGLYVINSDGTGMRSITEEELLQGGFLFRLPFVPDEIVKRAEEGGHFRRYRGALTAFLYEKIRWLPDGSAWIELGEDGLYVIHADGTRSMRLVEGQVYYYDVLPNGESVVYVKNDRIYSIDIDGSNQRELAQLQTPLDPGGDVLCGPDGDQILVSSGLPRPADLYLVNLENEEQQARHIFHTEGWLLNPQWSSDGQRIEFVLCDQQRTSSLVSIGRDGGDRHQVAWDIDLGECIHRTTWTSDRIHLVFSPFPPVQRERQRFRFSEPPRNDLGTTPE